MPYASNIPADRIHWVTKDYDWDRVEQILFDDSVKVVGVDTESRPSFMIGKGRCSYKVVLYYMRIVRADA